MRPGAFAPVAAALAIATAVGALPSEARGDDAADARFFDGLARRDFAAHRYRQALESFLLSQSVAPNPRTTFNIALTAKLTNEPVIALSHYLEYLTSDDDDADRRAQAEAAVAELRQLVPVLSVITEPPGATIYIDREELGARGVSPRLMTIEPGEHTVIAVLDGYRTAEATVVVEAQSSEQARLELTPITGTLRVEAEPTEARVVVLQNGDEVTRGAAPFVAELPIGRYRVRAEAPGYTPDATNVTVSEAQPAEARLVAQPRGRRAGTLLVSTGALAGAEVRLDGRWVGRTPVAIRGARAGERHLEVSAEGYRSWADDVTIPGGGALHVPVRLEPRDPE